MKTIDRIIERLPHDESRAELVAYLERLKEPGEEMQDTVEQAGLTAIIEGESVGLACIKAALEAAEEQE